MWKFKKLISGYDITSVRFNVAANQTIKKGDPVFLAAGVVRKATNADTTLLGIAADDVTTGASVAAGVDVLSVYMQKGMVWTVPYTTGTKTNLAAADVGAAGFGILDTGNLNLDDVTGPVAMVLDYNNTLKTADVILVNTQINV